MTVPSSTKPGLYNIDGYITTSGDTVRVLGSDTISVTLGDILSYYRELGLDPKKLETSDLLKASDDWRGGTIPQGYPASITTSQLLALADEWRGS